MNKVYKVVKNSSGEMSVCSELGKSGGKGKSIMKKLLLTALVSGSMSGAWALQDGTGSATGTNAVATGTDTVASGSNSTAIGLRTKAVWYNSTAMGYSTEASGHTSTAMGSRTQATGGASTAMGSRTEATGGASTAMGGYTQATGGASTAMGLMTNASRTASTAMGFKTEAGGIASTATGYDTEASGGLSFSGGSGSKAKGNGSFAFGGGEMEPEIARFEPYDGEPIEDFEGVGQYVRTISVSSEKPCGGATANTDGSIALGCDTVAGTDGGSEEAVAIGYRSEATGDKSLAIGFDSKATHEKSVALGQSAETKEFAQVNEATVGSLKYSGFAGTADGVVSVGKDGSNKQVVNMAAGEISETSTDAINGSQLYTTNKALSTVTNSVVSNLGGNATVSETGDITFTDIGGTGKDNIHDAIKSTANEFGNVYKNIGILEDEMSAGIAGAMAMGDAPFIPGKFTYAANAAHFNGESAIGLELKRTADNGRWSIAGGVSTTTQKEPLFRIGVTGIIN